jgi:hypothetical protein
MPQIVVNMNIPVANIVYRNTKIIVSNCGTRHIQTVGQHAKKDNETDIDNHIRNIDINKLFKWNK